MKKTRKALLLTVAIVTALSAVGCGEKTKNGENGDTMTIKWLGIPYFASMEEGSYAEKVMEERFNIEIEPVILDEEAYKNKKPIMLSSGDIPDIVYELDPADVQNDVRQKFLAEIPLSELKENIPEYVKHVTETAPQSWLYSNSDGKNYGIPNLYYQGGASAATVWRMDWLRNVGIDKVPETIDEMEIALEKFSSEDPDGNGKKDTYGMSGDVKSWHYSFSEIYGAYGVLPFDWMEVDGKIVYGGTLPEMKEALTTLARWYKKGIISPDFITDMTGTNITDKFISSQIGYHNYGASYSNIYDTEKETSYISKIQKTVPNAELAVGLLPKGPNGKSGKFNWGMAGHVIAFGRQLADEPEKRAKIFEIINALHTDEELVKKVEIGEENKHYRYIDGTNRVEFIEPYNDVKLRNKELGLADLGASAFYSLIPSKLELRDKFANENDIEFNEKYLKPNKVLFDAFLKPDVVPEAGKYLGDLRNKQMVYISEIICGEKDVDHYDDFIKLWNENGGKILEENANKTNDIYKNILSQLN